MTYRLTFRRSHKSISTFTSLVLPSLTVITGTNGSGKSHLLDAILRQAIITDLNIMKEGDIRKFDWNTILPDDTGPYNPAKLGDQVEATLEDIKRGREAAVQQAQNLLASLQIDTYWLNDIYDLQLAVQNDELPLYLEEAVKAAALSHLRGHLNSWAQNVANHVQTQLRPRQRSLVVKKAREAPHEVLFGSDKNIREWLWSEKPEVNAFQHALGRVFVEYRLKQAKERTAAIEGADHLTEEGFVAEYGPPPWEFLNEILSVNRLSFKINSPGPREFDKSFEPMLTKIDTQKELKFAELSSGEKVLMSFALCVYNSLGKDGLASFPKLLLLDEVDAPLHPEMVGFMLKTINEILIKRHKVNVILTTHKPTTIALSDEASLFQMNNKQGGLIKVDRDKALQLLTAGIPTLSLSLDARVQVFTESANDAQAFSCLYQCFKKDLVDERGTSLEFIAVGRKSKDGHEVDAGCARVTSLVDSLRQAGVSTAFGIIDWDCKNKPSTSISVLCYESRYAIENFLLDPVLIFCLLMKERIPYCRKQGFVKDNENQRQIYSWKQERWQAAVQSLVAQLDPSWNSESQVPVSYHGGLTINIPSQYLLMNGHELEKLIVSRIDAAKRNHLPTYIAKHIIPEFMEFVPIDGLQAFKNLIDLSNRKGS